MTPITLMNWSNYEIDMGDTYEFVSNFNAYLVDLEALIPQINTVVQEAEAARDAAEATAGFDGTYASLTSVPPRTFASITDVTSTAAEANHLVGVTSPLQGQIDGLTNADALLQGQIAGKSASGHSHAGAYEPADETILKDADIGIAVLAPDGDASGLVNVPATLLLFDKGLFGGI